MKLTVYKFLSIVLAGLLLVGAGFYGYEKYSHNKTKRELNNEVARLEQTVQETATAYSKMAVIAEGLESQNKELQELIEDRDEEIVAVNKVVVKWKDKYLKIKDAQGSVTDPDGNVAVLDPDCEECIKDKRFRVDFNQKDDILTVAGFTLTNPAYAELSLHWDAPLQLEVILTKNSDDVWRIYVDSANSEIIPAELTLTVDPSIFDKKWYEKIGFGIDVGVGPGVQTTVRAFYDVADNWFVGPLVTFQYDGIEFKTFYGATLGWFPFR